MRGTVEEVRIYPQPYAHAVLNLYGGTIEKYGELHYIGIWAARPCYRNYMTAAEL